jgi:ribosomal protein S26
MSDASESVVQCDWCGKFVPDDTSAVYHENQVYCTDCGTHLNVTQNRNK